MPGTWTNQATASPPLTADTYALLPAGQPDGTLCTVLSDNSVWRYSTLVSVWLPPEIVPTHVVADYLAASGLTPNNVGTSPQWAVEGTAAFGTVTGGILTITDTAAGNLDYRLADAVDLVAAKNVMFLVKLKVDDQNAGNDGYRSWIGLRVGASPICGAWLEYAYGDARKAQTNTAVTAWAQRVLYTAGTPSNDAWNTYFIEYNKSNGSYKVGVFGFATHAAFPATTGETSYSPANTAVWGTFSGGATITVDFEFAKIFNF